MLVGQKLHRKGRCYSFFYILLLFFTLSYSSNAREIKQEDNFRVKGKVVNLSGDGIPGVSIVEKGTVNGVASDPNGEYSIELGSADGVLIFSFIGMSRQEIEVQGRNIINVTMEDESEQLEELVVTGYQKVSRKMFTGSADVVLGEEARIDGSVDISKTLQGKTPGVQVTDVSGTFGAAPKLRIRGASSIYGSSNPLWVVDGVILDEMVELSASDLSSGNAATLIGSAVAGLNAEDIESFQILKDASATALYGAKAMNGVIVITTKKGEKGVSKLSYTSEFTIRMTPSYNKYDILNSQDQMGVYLEIEEKGLLTPASLFLAKNGGVFSKWYQLTDMRDENGNFLVENTEKAKLAYLQEAELRNTDWFKTLFRPSIFQNHSVSISSGTEKTSNYISFSYFNDPGWVPSSKVNRYTINANTTYNISDKLEFGILGNASIREQTAPGTLNQQLDVVGGEYQRDFDINPFSYALNTSRTMSPDEDYRQNYTSFNILNELENNYLQLDMIDVKVQGTLSYKPIKELELSLIGSYRNAKSTREHHILNKSNMAGAYRAAQSTLIINDNNFLYEDPDNPDALPLVVLKKGGFYNTQDNKLESFYARWSANYNKIFDGIHAVNLLVGGEINSTNRLARFNNGYGYLWGSDIAVTDYRIIQKVIDAGDNYFGMSELHERQVGVFSTATYSYNGKYTVNATLRTEGSNQMGESNVARWLPTWNISGSWNAKGEKFLSDVNFLSTLTFRGTYGLTATMSPNVNAAAIYNASTTYRPFQDDRETVLDLVSLANEELTWEKMKETNIGMDIGFFRRIDLSLDAYWRNSFDLIGAVRTSGIGGEHLKFANVANMESHGVELSLNVRAVKLKDFSVTNNLTFAYAKNEITNLKSTPMVIDLIGISGGVKEGYSQSGLFSIPFAGLDESGLPMFYDQDGNKQYYINFQSDNTDYLKYEGQLDPKFTGGLDNTIRYKQLSLSLFFTYQAGNVVRLYPSYSSTYSDMSAMSQEMKNRWVLPGDEEYTNIPAIPSAYQLNQNSNLVYAYNAYNFSTERVAKGDYIRLKTITVGYELNQKFVEKIGLSSLSLKGTASNVWLIFSDKKLNGQDPEFISSGGVAMPAPTQFTFTVRAGF